MELPQIHAERLAEKEFTRAFTVEGKDYLLELKGTQELSTLTFSTIDEEDEQGSFTEVTNAGFGQAIKVLKKVSEIAFEIVEKEKIKKVTFAPDEGGREVWHNKAIEKVAAYLDTKLHKLNTLMDGVSWSEHNYIATVQDDQVVMKFNPEDGMEDFIEPFTDSFQFQHLWLGFQWDSCTIDRIKLALENTDDVFWEDYGHKPTVDEFRHYEKSNTKKSYQRFVLYKRFYERYYPDILATIDGDKFTLSAEPIPKENNNTQNTTRL